MQAQQPLACCGNAQEKVPLAQPGDGLFAHPWQGRRVAYLGDSITDPDVKAGKEKWWTFLEQWLQLTSLVYGVNGQQWCHIPEQANRLYNDHGQDLDAILIFMGTNDFNDGIPLGRWFDEQEERVFAATGKPQKEVERKRRMPNKNPGTLCGRINIAMEQLKKCYPEKQIVLLTPIHRGYAFFGNNNVQPPENYQNSCGLYFDSYVKAIREAGEIWAVPVIDLAQLSGLLPTLTEHHQYFANPDTDQLHPNDKGYQRLARTLYYQLLTLPTQF
ncbi:MAG: SGNH/GDSL hydrolase family protein [Prevotella sp.]|nr:SGNH/GDSL hydrolase family protein [Prevotella sp.]